MTFLEFFSPRHADPIEHGPFDDELLLGSKVADESPRIIKMIRLNAEKATPKEEIARALCWPLSRLERVARNAKPRIVFVCEARVVDDLTFEQEARGA